MSRLRQLMRSIRENGGSVNTLCRAEHGRVANGLADPVAAVNLEEEAPEPVRRDVLSDGLGIETGAGLIDTGCIQVGGKDLERELQARQLPELRERHRDGIGLLSGRAPDRPHPHRLMA